MAAPAKPAPDKEAAVRNATEVPETLSQIHRATDPDRSAGSMRVCIICRHAAEAEINSALINGATYREIASRFAVSKSALYRHRPHVAKVPPPDTSNRDLSLLTNPDGSLMEKVTPRVGAQFLKMSLQQIRNCIYNGTLASEGFGKQRRVLVSSLLAYEPYTSEKRSANTKKWWNELAPEERSDHARKAAAWWDKFTPEERSARAEAIWAKMSPEDRKAFGKAQFANLTSEQRSANNKAQWANKTPEEQSAVVKAMMAKLTPEKLSANGRKGAKERWNKTTPEDHKAFGKNMLERRKAIAIAEYLETVGNGAAAAKTSKEPSLKRKAAADFLADWVTAGRPSSGDAIVNIAKPYYPKKVSWSEQYPSRRQARRDQIIRAFKELLRREETKVPLVHEN
jgi:hypothetical protein